MAHLYRRSGKTGTSWQVKWRKGGRRDAPWSSETFGHEARAEAFRLDVEAAGDNWPAGWVKGQGYVVTAQPKVTLMREVAEDYFQLQSRRVARGKIAAYTVHRYLRTWVLHMSETFEGMACAEVTKADIDGWIDAQMEAGWSAKSIRNRHGIFYSVMQHGVLEMDLRPNHPSKGVELPQADAREARQIRFFQHGEWRLFRSCLTHDVRLLVDVMLATGLRWGEVSALRRGDVTRRDDGTVILHVVRAWSKRAPDDKAEVREAESENRSWKLGPPKGRKSRFVTLHGDAADRLWEEVQGLGDRGYVFVTREGNPWRYPDFHSDRWAPARRDAERLGLTKHATPHMLRHTTCVWALADGIKIEVVSEMLGHAGIQITMDVYGGFIDLTDPAMAQAMAGQMLMAERALTPVADAEMLAARRVRPGRRGESRRRAS